MVYCSHCGDDRPVTKDPDYGYICCVECGRIVDQQDVWDTRTTFLKDGRPTSHVLRSVEQGYTMSRHKTMMKARDEIKHIVDSLQVIGGESIVDKAHCFYEIALDKNFTRGRRVTHVAAACLYIACRQNKLAYLLIDFSDYLEISVYVLGAVFLELCKVLHFADHPFVQTLIDPSLFIHRFTERLLGKRNRGISDTALRIVASMKRNWMQTGRKPSGLCGAALYISALSHGLNLSKSDIVTVVHVCEATLTKRLIEFENTDSGALTIEEFLAQEITFSNCSPKPGEVLCKHKDDEDAEHFAHGLCKTCYDEFVEISGGLEGGADPPAFQRAERCRLEAAKKLLEEADNDGVDGWVEGAEMASPSASCKHKGQDSTGFVAVGKGSNSMASEVPKETDNTCNGSSSSETSDQNGDGDPESLSDIDDVEVDEYLLQNEEEKHLKKLIWEEMNREYLEEQAAKEALAADKNPDDNLENKPKKERKRKREDSEPAETPAEATCNILKRKGLGSKINPDAVGELYAMHEGGNSPDAKHEKKDEANGDTTGEIVGDVDDDGDIDFAEYEDEDNYMDFAEYKDKNFGLEVQDDYDYMGGGGEQEFII